MSGPQATSGEGHDKLAWSTRLIAVSQKSPEFSETHQD
jgi:hypothetical protein